MSQAPAWVIPGGGFLFGINLGTPGPEQRMWRYNPGADQLWCRHSSDLIRAVKRVNENRPRKLLKFSRADIRYGDSLFVRGQNRTPRT